MSNFMEEAEALGIKTVFVKGETRILYYQQALLEAYQAGLESRGCCCIPQATGPCNCETKGRAEAMKECLRFTSVNSREAFAIQALIDKEAE